MSNGAREGRQAAVPSAPKQAQNHKLFRRGSVWELPHVSREPLLGFGRELVRWIAHVKGTPHTKNLTNLLSRIQDTQAWALHGG